MPIGSGGIVEIFLPAGGTAGQAVVKIDGVDYNFTFGAGGGGAGIGGIAAGTQTATTNTVVFSNSNNVTFGMTNSSIITASASQSVQTQASGAIARSGFTSAGNNIGLSGTLNSGGLSLSATVAAQSNQSAIRALGVSNTGNTAGNTGVSTGIDWVIAGSNGITASESTVGGGPNTIWISGSTYPAQTVQTQASGAIAGSGFTTAGNNIGLSGTLNSLGLNFSATVAAQSNQSAIRALGASNTGNTAGNTGVSTGIDWVIAGSNNITISESTAGGGPNTLWISGPNVAGAQTGISGIQVSDTTYTSGTVTWRNANGISFGSSGANGISASYTVPTVTNSSWTVSDAATSATVGRLAFTQSNGLTLSLSTSNNGNHTVIGSYTVPTVTNSSMTVSDAATSGTLARLAFTNLNGVTLSLSTGAGGSHTIVGSHNALTSQSNQAFSAAGGASAFQTLGFSDNAAASFTNTNGSVAIASVRASLFATSNTTQSSTGTANLNSLIFAGAGLASVGVTNGSVVISVPSGGGAGDGGVFAGVSTAGNTAGSTGTVSTGNFVLVGTGALTLSQSTGAAGSAATVTMSVPQTSSIVGTNGISVATNGSTISVSALQYTGSWWQPELWGNSVTTTFANNTVYFRPLAPDLYLKPVKAIMMVSNSSSASTASFSASVSAGNATSGTATWGHKGTFLLFSRVNTNDTHADYNKLISFDSHTYSFGAGYSASVSWSTNASSATASVTTSGAVSWISAINDTGGVTTASSGTTGSTSFSSTSTNANSFSSSFILTFPYAHLSGVRPIFAPLSGTTMSPGEYWMGLQVSTASASTNISLQRVAMMGSVHYIGFTALTNAYMELGNSVAITSSNYRLGFGSHSGSNQTTTTMGLTAVSTNASNYSQWFMLDGRSMP